MPPAPRVISKVEMLVHPFFVAPLLMRGEVGTLQKTASYLLNMWGQRVKHVERDPHALFIILRPDSMHPKVFEDIEKSDSKVAKRIGSKWFFWRLNKFIAFAEKKLGDRCVVLEDTLIQNKALPTILKERNFVWHRVSSPGKRAIRGVSFGEYFNQCVDYESAELAQFFGVSLRRFKQISHLSIESRYLGLGVHRDPFSLGAYSPGLPKKGKKVFRKLKQRTSYRKK